MTDQKRLSRRSIVIIILLIVFGSLIVYDFAEKYCEPAKRVDTNQKAIFSAIGLVKPEDSGKFFQGIGGSSGFADKLANATNCCSARQYFSWLRLQTVWDVDLQLYKANDKIQLYEPNEKPNFFVFLKMDRCGNVLRTGNLQWD